MTKRRVFIRFLVFLSLCMLPLFNAAAETFRVQKTIVLNISPKGERVSVKAGVNDALLISLPLDNNLIQGIEITFKVPQEVASRKDSVAWCLYDGLTPSPAAGNLDYSGIRSTQGTFGTSLSLTLKIPLYSNNSIKKDAYSYYVSNLPDTTNGNIFLRLFTPDKMYADLLADSSVEVLGKPIFMQKGKLRLNVKADDSQKTMPYTLFVDGVAVEQGTKETSIAVGIHDISLISDYYRNEVRTVNIEQGKVTELSIELTSIKPVIRIVAPEGTKIFLDGESIQASNSSNSDFTVTPGEHTVKFEIGDYEIVKSVTAMNGNSYTVAVQIDASVTEQQF